MVLLASTYSCAKDWRTSLTVRKNVFWPAGCVLTSLPIPTFSLTDKWGIGTHARYHVSCIKVSSSQKLRILLKLRRQILNSLLKKLTWTRVIATSACLTSLATYALFAPSPASALACECKLLVLPIPRPLASTATKDVSARGIVTKYA
jgi:hypothetical protein